MSVMRHRRDECPGVIRPWQASDGLLVRLRLIGGRVGSQSLRSLSSAAEEFGDGLVHVTSRANLQLRGFPGTDGRLATEALAALEGTGMLPSLTHDLVRNVMASPQTGVSGGRVDLRPVAAELDGLLCAQESLAGLPGKFLFVLDDGRGDLVGRTCDLGMAALDSQTCQLRIGEGWGDVIPVQEAASRLAALADRFVAVRGTGPEAPWHVAELHEPVTAAQEPDPRLPSQAPPLPYGPVSGGHHHPVPDQGLDRAAVTELAGCAETLIVTPWRGVFIPEEDSRA